MPHDEDIILNPPIDVFFGDNNIGKTNKPIKICIADRRGKSIFPVLMELVREGKITIDMELKLDMKEINKLLGSFKVAKASEGKEKHFEKFNYKYRKGRRKLR